MARPELETALSIPPKDCTGDCGYGPCNCSGEWQVGAYTKESVDKVVEYLTSYDGISAFLDEHYNGAVIYQP